jgi:CTP:molybdopterin cytidylyltransferase MocA
VTLDVIISAGGTAGPRDPLYPLIPGGYKALLPVHGRPIVRYVIDAFAGVRETDRILLYGLPPDAPLGLPDLDARVERLPGQGGILQNVEHGIVRLRELGSQAELVALAAGDVPLLTSAIFEAHLAQCRETEHDFYYPVIAEPTMRARFPDSRRTYARLREGTFCGGDVDVVRRAHAEAMLANRALWQGLIDGRKNPLRQAAQIGFVPLLQFVFGRMTIPEAERVFARLIGGRARAVLSPYPELGMDVDKPFQLEIAERALG